MVKSCWSVHCLFSTSPLASSNSPIMSPLLDPSPSPSPPPSLPPPPTPVLHPIPSSPSIGDKVALLPCPSDDETWAMCFVQPKDFEPVNTSWAKIRHLPQFHVVGKLKDRYMVAVAAFVLPVLNYLEVPYSYAHGQFSSDWRPHQDVSSDRQKFVQNAIAGISTRARGLVDLYRGMFKDWSTVSSELRVPIEWAIFLRDIKVCFLFFFIESPLSTESNADKGSECASRCSGNILLLLPSSRQPPP